MASDHSLRTDAAEAAVPSASRKSAVIRLAHRLGGRPTFYSALRAAMGGDRYWQCLLGEVAAVRPGMRVLDVGCGPARVLSHVPVDVGYVGVDHNQRCIDQARRRSWASARFLCCEASSIAAIDGEFDRVFAMGLLHHLSDSDAEQMIEGAARLLAPGGELITADVVHFAGAARSAAWLLARDRGDFVRDAAGYRRLLKRSFETVDASLRTDLLRVPLTGAPYPLLIASSRLPLLAASQSAGLDSARDLAPEPLLVG